MLALRSGGPAGPPSASIVDVIAGFRAEVANLTIANIKERFVAESIPLPSKNPKKADLVTTWVQFRVEGTTSALAQAATMAAVAAEEATTSAVDLTEPELESQIESEQRADCNTGSASGIDSFKSLFDVFSEKSLLTQSRPDRDSDLQIRTSGHLDKFLSLLTQQVQQVISASFTADDAGSRVLAVKSNSILEALRAVGIRGQASVISGSGSAAATSVPSGQEPTSFGATGLVPANSFAESIHEAYLGGGATLSFGDALNQSVCADLVAQFASTARTDGATRATISAKLVGSTMQVLSTYKNVATNEEVTALYSIKVVSTRGIDNPQQSLLELVGDQHTFLGGAWGQLKDDDKRTGVLRKIAGGEHKGKVVFRVPFQSASAHLRLLNLDSGVIQQIQLADQANFAIKTKPNDGGRGQAGVSNACLWFALSDGLMNRVLAYFVVSGELTLDQLSQFETKHKEQANAARLARVQSFRSAVFNYLCDPVLFADLAEVIMRTELTLESHNTCNTTPQGHLAMALSLGRAVAAATRVSIPALGSTMSEKALMDQLAGDTVYKVALEGTPLKPEEVQVVWKDIPAKAKEMQTANCKTKWAAEPAEHADARQINLLNHLSMYLLQAVGGENVAQSKLVAETSEKQLQPLDDVVRALQLLKATSFTDGENASTEILSAVHIMLGRMGIANIALMFQRPGSLSVPSQLEIHHPFATTRNEALNTLVLMHSPGDLHGKQKHYEVVQSVHHRTLTPVRSQNREQSTIGQLWGQLQKLAMVTANEVRKPTETKHVCCDHCSLKKTISHQCQGCAAPLDPLVPAQIRCITCNMQKGGTHRTCVICETSIAALSLTKVACDECATLEAERFEKEQTRKFNEEDRERRQAATRKEEADAIARATLAMGHEIQRHQLHVQQGGQDRTAECQTCGNPFVPRGQGRAKEDCAVCRLTKEHTVKAQKEQQAAPAPTQSDITPAEQTNSQTHIKATEQARLRCKHNVEQAKLRAQQAGQLARIAVCSRANCKAEFVQSKNKDKQRQDCPTCRGHKCTFCKHTVPMLAEGAFVCIECLPKTRKYKDAEAKKLKAQGDTSPPTGHENPKGQKKAANKLIDQTSPVATEETGNHGKWEVAQGRRNKKSIEANPQVPLTYHTATVADVLERVKVPEGGGKGAHLQTKIKTALGRGTGPAVVAFALTNASVCVFAKGHCSLKNCTRTHVDNVKQPAAVKSTLASTGSAATAAANTSAPVAAPMPALASAPAPAATSGPVTVAALVPSSASPSMSSAMATLTTPAGDGYQNEMPPPRPSPLPQGYRGQMPWGAQPPTYQPQHMPMWAPAHAMPIRPTPMPPPPPPVPSQQYWRQPQRSPHQLCYYGHGNVPTPTTAFLYPEGYEYAPTMTDMPPHPWQAPIMY